MKKKYIVIKYLNGSFKTPEIVFIRFEELIDEESKYLLKNPVVIGTKGPPVIEIQKFDNYDKWKWHFSHYSDCYRDFWIYDPKDHLIIEFDSDETAKLFFELGEYNG